MTPDIIREPYQGIYYYADPGAKYAKLGRKVYDLRIWRDTISAANREAKDLQKYLGYETIVRRIAFHIGKVFIHPGIKKTIYCYGVYTRAGKING